MTAEKVATFKDKSSWGPGAWQDEPDRIEWRMPDIPSLACLILRGPMGNLCGYVGVQPGHPAHGIDWGAVDVDVHGGLTYSAPCDEREGCDVLGLICHVPEPGESDDVNARMKSRVGRHADMPPMPEPFRDTYKTVEYVRGEVEQLARQLAAMADGKRDP